MGAVTTIIALIGMAFCYMRLQQSREAHKETLRKFIDYINQQKEE